MQNLVVCVGEKCHQSGAEMVLRSFLDIISQQNLENEVCLKCSFTIGGCCHENEVSVQLGDHRFAVPPRDSREVFARDIQPHLHLPQED